MDPLNTLDREIEQALAVDPSPEFVARVRQRIASEPAPSSSWPWLWRFAAAGALAAAVLVAAIVSRTDRSTTTERTVLTARTFSGTSTLPAAGVGAELAPPVVGAELAPPVIGAELAPPVVGAELAPPVVGAELAPPPRAGQGRPLRSRATVAQALRLAIATREPEILLDAREVAALRALISGVRSGRIDLARLQRDPPKAAVKDLAVEPIVISDIPFVPSTEGVRQ